MNRTWTVIAKLLSIEVITANKRTEDLSYQAEAVLLIFVFYQNIKE